MCDGKRYGRLYRIESLSGGSVTAGFRKASPTIRTTGAVTLYQALPKADKLEWIVQKSVELGVFGIVPFMSSRCVSGPLPRTLKKKRAEAPENRAGAAKQADEVLSPGGASCGL